MPIRTGIGVGEAQIYDTSGLVNSYIRNLELNEKRNQKKLEMLADITKDIPETLGARKVDETDLKTLYSGIKDLNAKAEGLVGTKGYNQAVSDVENKVKSYKEAIYRSKKQAESELNGARFIAQNIGFVEDEDIKKFNERKNTPILNLVDDYDVASSILIPKTDARKSVESILMGKEGEQLAKPDKSATENVGGGALQYYKVLKPEDAITIIKEKLLDVPYRRLAYYEYKKRNPEATEINDDIVARSEYDILAPKGAIKFKAYTQTPQSSGSGSRDKLTGTDLLALNTRNSFGGNAKAIKNIVNSSRGNIVNIERTPDNKVVIYPAPEIKIFDLDGRQVGTKRTNGKAIIVDNLDGYFKELRQLGISSSDMSVLAAMEKLGPGPTNVTPTQKPKSNQKPAQASTPKPKSNQKPASVVGKSR